LFEQINNMFEQITNLFEQITNLFEQINNLFVDYSEEVLFRMSSAGLRTFILMETGIGLNTLQHTYLIL